MKPLFYPIFAAGAVLELILIWRIQRGRLWRTYPFLCIYLYYVAARTFILFGALKLWPSVYAVLYWRSDLVATFLSLFIPWEVFRYTFPTQVTFRGVVLKGLCALVAGLALAHWLSGRSLTTYGADSIFAVAERDASFVQAVLLLSILLGARYYGVILGRNLWGVTIGLGISVSISTANYAAFALLTSFMPYWQIIGPVSFVTMLGVWTWALWVYAPNPAFTASTLEDREPYLSQWNEAWNRMLGTLRRILEP
jgi:hypothetical protein